MCVCACGLQKGLQKVQCNKTDHHQAESGSILDSFIKNNPLVMCKFHTRYWCSSHIHLG